MQGDDLIRVGWALLKTEFAIKPLRMSYTQNGASYQVYAVSPSYGLWAIVVDASEVADFEVNYKAAAKAVGSGNEAVAISMLPQVSASILNSQDSGRSFGYRVTSAVDEVPVRATDYTVPGTDAKRSLVSTSAADKGTGAGARRIKITYMDAAGSGPFTESVRLEGTTPVNTVASNIAFIEKIEVVKVGPGGMNAGSIQLYTGEDGAGSVIGSIAVGDNQTYWAHHYVPAKKKCSIMQVGGSATVTPGGLTPVVNDPTNDAIPTLDIDIPMRHGTTQAHRTYDVPLQVDGPALIVLTETPDAATGSTIFAGFSWIQF